MTNTVIEVHFTETEHGYNTRCFDEHQGVECGKLVITVWCDLFNDDAIYIIVLVLYC